MLIFVKVTQVGNGALTWFEYRLMDGAGFHVPSRSKGYRTGPMARAAGERSRKRILKREFAS